MDPWGIAIDPINNRIFLADNGLQRIQIFSRNGEWVKSLKNEHLQDSENINISHNSLFIQCNRSIVKFHRTSFAIESLALYDFWLSGICTDNTNVYVGTYGIKLIALNHKLGEERFIPLITQYKQETTRIRDISIDREEFYVILTESEYPIQSFSKQGTLNRCIVNRDSLIDVWCFCLDQQLNILLADRGNSQVKIFSNDGKLITKFGRVGFAKGGFIYIRGIAVEDSCDIITTDLKDRYKLQAFSPE